MSAYITLRISRKRAIEVWMEAMLSVPSDDELESFMDDRLDHRLYNCIIVDDSDADNDDGIV